MKTERSLAGKLEAQKRDRERKRRDQLTSEQLECVRSTERNYKKLKRQNMTETEKQEARKARKKKFTPTVSKKRKNLSKLKEMRNIEKALRMRKLRSLLSEKENELRRNNAKVGMALGRKNGSLRAYKQRKRRERNDLDVWRHFLKHDVQIDLFLETNSENKKVVEKITSVHRQIRDQIQLSRAKNYRMSYWTGRSYNKKDEVSSDSCSDQEDDYNY